MSRHLLRKMSRKTTSTDAAVKKVLRNKAKTQEEKLDRSTNCREAIEGLGTFSIDPPSCRGSVEIAIRKSLRSSTDSQVSMRFRGRVELAFKISFFRREKQRHECNQACNPTNDPINILSSQNYLSIAILSTRIPKTHTHTH